METSKIEPAASLLDENKRLIAEIKILKDRQQAASKKEFITEAFDPQEPGTGAGQLTGQETPGKANAEEVSGPGSTFLYVEGLPVDIDDPKLSSLFSEAGEVLSTKLLASGYFAKNGLVEMSSEEEAQNAITRFHRRKNSGVTLNVRIAGPKEKSLFDMSS
jgi:RNA recognition motif-containing protein